MRWPEVLTEAETLERVVAGASIARFGDGELKICCGGATVTHARNVTLAVELRAILLDPAPSLLPAIPNPRAVEKRWVSWESQREQWAKLMDPARVYGSAFVGRPKVAPWVDTLEHRARFRSLWRDGRRPVVVVSSADHPIAGWLRRDGADVAAFVECQKLEAYDGIDRVEQAVANLTLPTALVVICAGPMAKPLANRLARHGVQAIDLGRGAGFLYKGQV
jgi:hypothetical protein